GLAAVSAEGLLPRTLNPDRPPPAPTQPNTVLSGEIQNTLTIHGPPPPGTVAVDPRTPLLSALRDRLDPALTGPKLVCNVATCGACTVLLDGKPVYGCSVLAGDAVGKKIETDEG